MLFPAAGWKLEHVYRFCFSLVGQLQCDIPETYLRASPQPPKQINILSFHKVLRILGVKAFWEVYIMLENDLEYVTIIQWMGASWSFLQIEWFKRLEGLKAGDWMKSTFLSS